MLQDQEMIEKALQNVGVSSPNGGGDSPINEAVEEPSITKKATSVHTQEEDSMSGKAPEMIEKSQYEEVLKQQQETQNYFESISFCC